jgi:hypothetical protein
MYWLKGVLFLASPIYRSDPPQLLPVGLCERRCLRFTDAYNPEQLEGSNTNSNCKNYLAFIAKCLAQSWISSDMCRATNGAHTKLAEGMKKLFRLFFTIVCI